ncbi:MAG: DUF364 domain-containing protein, partial [Pontiellaceae bacterium]|nr:DUF364 domain-containing protein [Pontiellaceae bacterium]
QVNGLLNDQVSIRCRGLSAKEAIGEPEHKDYPIIKGKELLVEADFHGAKGQAFTDEYETAQYRAGDIPGIRTEDNRSRATFVAAFNAVYRYLNRCAQTVHCRNEEPVTCAGQLKNLFAPGSRVLLVGYQPRFLEYLVKDYTVRVLDMDRDNVGEERFGVTVEPATVFEEALSWCDSALVTGSTLVNGTIADFIGRDKKIIFYGTTIAGPAKVLGIETYCFCGH